MIYRQRAIGVLVAFRKRELFKPTYEAGLQHTRDTTLSYEAYWARDDLAVLEAVAGVVALLLENTRLLERDRQRIHELSLLNSIASQLNLSIYEAERLYALCSLAD